MYTLIENFCLGTRRLELFGRQHSLRRGWVTVTSEELKLTPEQALERDHATPFEKEAWETSIKELAQGGKCVVPSTQGENRQRRVLVCFAEGVGRRHREFATKVACWTRYAR